MLPISELQAWIRRGRGKSFQFFACDEEVEALLSNALPKRLAPYTVMGLSMTRVDNEEYEQRVELFDISRFTELRHKGIWQLFLLSHSLSNDFDPAAGGNLQYLSFNGLVNIQHGRLRKGVWQPSSLGIVNEIVHVQTGEVIQHSEYLSIYNTLVAALKKRLCVKTKPVSMDRRNRVSRQPAMTKAFAELLKRGELQISVSPIHE